MIGTRRRARTGDRPRADAARSWALADLALKE
jgi:hypothetical protein